MKIACYAIAYNEELMLPHFISHYKKICDKIVIYDNMSTDKTKEIALDNGCEVIQWEAPGGGLNDLMYLNIKSNCFKKDRDNYSWAITVDIDEFISHVDGENKFLETLEKFSSDGVKLPDVSGVNMFSWDHDLKNSLDSIKSYIPSQSYSKSVVFDTSLDISWHPGCHICNIENDALNSGIILKHYKFINFEHVISRSELFNKRLSETNKLHGHGIHYTWTRKEWFNYFLDLDKGKLIYGS